MKFLTFTGSLVRNRKFPIYLIDYVQNFRLKDVTFLTFTLNLHFNCWLVRVSYGVIVHISFRIAWDIFDRLCLIS